MINPKEKPVSFIITQFHIIFVYKDNFTILSTINQQIMYSITFTELRPIRGASFDIYNKNLLLMGTSTVGLEYAVIENEDKDAWTQYMKKGMIR